MQRQSAQTWNNGPSFCLTLLEKADVSTGGVRTILTTPKATHTEVLGEGLTLRCGNADCTLRARAGARCTDMLGEIDAEDRAPNQFELLQAEVEDADGGIGWGLRKRAAAYLRSAAALRVGS